VRKATKRDLQVLIAEAGDFHIQPLVVYFKKNLAEKERERLSKYVPLTFVAIHSRKIVGYAQQKRDGGIIFISTRRGFNRLGIGRKLMGKLSARLIKMGIGTLEITSNGTFRARKFYEKIGFSRAEIGRNRYIKKLPIKKLPIKRP
jgi:ribosomal protein S18 acetylase RimI-like enzyme